MTGKDFYDLIQEQRRNASRLARETVKAAREQKIDIPTLVMCLCEEYAASEADIAERGAYDGGYNEGYSAGRTEERRGW